MLSVEELSSWSLSPPPAGTGLVLVDLASAPGAAPDVVARAVDAARLTPFPVVGVVPDADLAQRDEVSRVGRALLSSVGVGGTAPDWAVAVGDLDAALAELGSVATSTPQAVAVLGQVLRAGEGLTSVHGLRLESLAYATLQGGGEHAGWLATRSPRPLPGDTDATVAVQRSADVLRVRLERPGRRNALDTAMRQALAEALQTAVADPGLRVELSGAGPSFCSGGDLDEFGRVSDPATAHALRAGGGPAFPMARVGPRTTAHVHGAVVGAGIELAAFAHRLVAARDTTVRLPEVAMGLIPGAGGTVSLPGRVGRWRAAWLLLTGVELDLTTALAWGLVDDVV